MRILFFISLNLSILFCQAQMLQSPEEFLGYPVGARFTPHHQVVSYFEKAAAAKKTNMKLEFYGQTQEGRELLLAMVSTPENMKQLEEIRLNNLRMTGLLTDKPFNPNMPVVVWLSYNVHGNEASSTEVALQVLYDLLADKNSQIQKWLNDVVVVIDPCLNPDGRDRYVNWFQQTMGKVPNPNPLAREHSEPWPGGRTNHYNFDLNRDWAWQTQIESRQRVEKYNEWMPQIHCDFHEQYPENPYYFAPAAEPMHEVITPWQRSFQTIIGKNHAKYFDANGWLYFTKEVFDLFYPSYGDTYPMFNGSIGMTYEQAGHSKGGLAIQVNDDTLTLSDRVQHHYSTSLSTIEVCAMHAREIQVQYKKYFDANRLNGSGEYSSYVLCQQGNPEKMKALLNLLDNNRILYRYAQESKSLKGFHYENQQITSFTLSPNDVIVSSMQPKGALVKVLFEPSSSLSDSLTYDITAWAMPYVYGIDAYAIKEKLSVASTEKPVVKDNTVLPGIDAYGYLIPYRSFSGARLLASFLSAGLKIRFAEKDFKMNGTTYKKGTLIVLQNENKGKIGDMLILFKKFQNEAGCEIAAIQTGFVEAGMDFGSEKVHLIKAPAVGLVTGSDVNANAAGEIWHLFEQQLQYPITLINSHDLPYVDLKKLDVLILPDGDYRLLKDKESSLKTWIRQGGKLIALENAVVQMAEGDWGIKLKKDTENGDVKETEYKDLKRYEDREREGVSNAIPGAIYHVQLDDSHPLAMGYDQDYFTLKQNVNVLEFLKEGWNVGAIKQADLMAGFVGSNIREKIKDGTVLAVDRMGAGSVVCFTDNPVFRSFWQHGKLLLSNAVFLVGQ